MLGPAHCKAIIGVSETANNPLFFFSFSTQVAQACRSDKRTLLRETADDLNSTVGEWREVKHGSRSGSEYRPPTLRRQDSFRVYIRAFGKQEKEEEKTPVVTTYACDRKVNASLRVKQELKPLEKGVLRVE